MVAKLTSSASLYPFSSHLFSTPLTWSLTGACHPSLLHLPLKPLTQASIFEQPIPTLHATHNNISIRVSHTWNPSAPPFPSGCLTPGILQRRHFHSGVSHPEPFSAAISTRVPHTWNPSAPPFPSGCLTPRTLLHRHFHPGASHPESFSTAIST